MLKSLTSIFKQLLDGQPLSNNDTPDLAIAALLCEVASADHQVEEVETRAKQSLLQELLDISEVEAVTLLEQAMLKVKESVSLYDFTSRLRELERETRLELIKAMWHVAYADGYIDPIEELVIRKTAELLYVEHSEFIRAKIKTIESL
ncbi:MAG: TerB family tellurite resistance protein [Psychromonas sp.]|nr:TerB family tellurite resistance protein [Psychromonas sp.]